MVDEVKPVNYRKIICREEMILDNIFAAQYEAYYPLEGASVLKVDLDSN